MLKIIKRYRKDYRGEDIVTERTYQNGVWTAVTEHLPNNVINNQISNRAVVIGNGSERLRFDVQHLLKVKSGLLGADTLQSYACNAFYRDFTPDFLIATSKTIAEELVNTSYTLGHIVYTRVDIALEFPKHFYLVPYDPYTDAGTTAMYIACFDGHKKIFMLGFDGQPCEGLNQNVYAGTQGYSPINATISDEKWINDRAQLFDAYNDVDFVWVTERGRLPMPEAWKYRSNIRQIDFRNFVLEADL